MLTGFTKQQVISLLSSHTLWGKKACREILNRKDEFIPLLIEILDNAIDDPDPYIYGEKDDHIPAALLLAQMKVCEAYPRLIKLISYDEETVGALWGDILTQDYTQMLRDTFNEDGSLLPRLIEDRSICEWARSMSVLAYGMHYFDDWHNPLFAADDLHIDDAIKNLDYWEWFKKKEDSED